MKRRIRVTVSLLFLVGLNGCATKPKPVAVPLPTALETVSVTTLVPTPETGDELAFAEPTRDLLVSDVNSDSVPSSDSLAVTAPGPIRWPQVLGNTEVALCIGPAMSAGVFERVAIAPTRADMTAFLDALRECNLLEAFATSESLGNIALSDPSLVCVQDVYRRDADETVKRLLVRFSPGEVGDVTRTIDPKLIFACITPTERSLIGDSINLSSPLVPVPDEVMFEFKPVTNAIS